jgi:hypothetical protein
MLVVHIINQSGHTLRIPDPPLLSKPAPGLLSLQVKFIPENSNENEGQPECDLEVAGGGLPDIRERAKKWLVLKPGQDYAARRPLAMALNRKRSWNVKVKLPDLLTPSNNRDF